MSYRLSHSPYAILTIGVFAMLSACGESPSRQVVVDGLDLAVTGVMAPTEASEGTTVEIHVAVENVGTVASAAASLRFEVGEAGGTRDELDRIDLPALAPGATHDVTHSLVLPASLASGQYQLAAIVDAVGDAIESNDTAVAAFHVSGTACAPDSAENNDVREDAATLVLELPRYVNFCEDSVDWYAFEAVAGTEIGILIEAPSAMVGHSLFAPDGTTAILVGFGGRMSFVPTSSGTHFVAVQVFPEIDAQGQVHSGIGPNTDYEIRVFMPVPDLAGSSLYGPGSVPQGGVGAVTAYVENVGVATSQPASIGLYLSTDAIITKDDRLLASSTIPALAAGDTEGIDFLVAFPPAYVGAYHVDALVADFDRSNNVTDVATLTIAANTCTPDANEADDVLADAVPLSLDTTVSANHCEDYYDWFSVALTGGVAYSIVMTPADAFKLNPGIEVTAPDGITVLADEPDGRLDFVAPSTGTYYVDATDTWDMSTRPRIGAPHTYTLRIEERLPDFAPSTAYLNPTDTVAGGVLEYDFGFANAGFTTAGPHRIGLYVSTDAVVTTGDRLLATFDRTDLPLTGTGTIDASLYIPHDLAAGNYFVAAIADDLGQIRERDEANNVAPARAFTVVASTCTRDAFEFDDSLASAKGLPFGPFQNRNFCDDATDWVSFSASAGDDVLLDFTGSLVSGVMQVFDANGVSLAGPSPTTENDLFFEAPSTGTFYARIGSQPQLYATSGTRDYQLRAGLCAMDASEDNGALATAKGFTIGQTLSLNFCDDYEDWFAFTAVSGVQYVIETGSLGGNVDTRLYLHNAAGSSLASNDDINGGTQASRITWTAPASGTYYVEVVTWFNQWGFDSAYTLNIR